VEAPSGTILGSQAVQSPLGDLFRLQDDLAQRLVESLALPLAGRGGAEAPRSAHAYELYLRANELARSHAQLPQARALYQQCVEEDPRFAPAWARLGRCHRVIDKYYGGEPELTRRAEESFRHALSLNPELPVAHKLYAHLEAEMGRAPQAMERLLRQAAANRNDPELFAGLVHACRYCGLNEASEAAHQEARRLDPNVPTSFPYTLLFTGQLERLAREDCTAVLDRQPQLLALRWLERSPGIGLRQVLPMQGMPDRFQQMVDAFDHYHEGRRDRARAAMLEIAAFHTDPEAFLMFGDTLVRVGAREEGLALLEQAVAGGFWPVWHLRESPGLAPVRDDPRFQALYRRAAEGRADAERRFRAAGGERLLGASALGA
jgi:eukaryotic-like serine/threonine-protein kinase